MLDCGEREATAQIDRLSVWVCGSYKVQSGPEPRQLTIAASIGLAERAPGETMKELLARADAAMYMRKAASRSGGTGAKR